MSFTNAQLAQKISDLIDYWSSFNTEYSDWLGGTVDGGPGADGKYPLTNWAGAESLIDSPAKLADNVSGYVGLASASETAAAASAAAAATSESNASTSASTATAQAVLADADRVAAELAEANALSSQTVSTAQANLATDRAGYAAEWANKAEDSLVSAAAGGDLVDDYSAMHHATKGAVSAAAALASEIAAAASAAAAATFDPVLYAALADNETITGSWTIENTVAEHGLVIYNDTNTKTLDSDAASGWRIVQGQPGQYDGYLLIGPKNENTFDISLKAGSAPNFAYGLSVSNEKSFSSGSSASIAFYKPYTETQITGGGADFAFRGNNPGDLSGTAAIRWRAYVYGATTGFGTIANWTVDSDKYPTFAFLGDGSFSGTLAVTGAVTGSNLNVSNWDTAYGWGDHAGLYSLVAHNHAGVYEPVDATLVRTTDLAWNATDWDTAFGWGNHASGGYAPLAAPSFTGGITTDGLAVNGNTDLTGTVDILDAANGNTHFNYAGGQNYISHLNTGWTRWRSFDGVSTYTTFMELNSGGLTMYGVDGTTFNLELQGTAPTIYLKDTDTSADDFWIHVNSNNFYVLRDNADDGSWDSPHPLQLEADTNLGYLFGGEIVTTEEKSHKATPMGGLDLGTTDLNTINTTAETGFYFQNSNADTTGNNYPNAHAGSLLVQKSAGITQLYQTYTGSNRLYFRAYYSSSWSSWYMCITDAGTQTISGAKTFSSNPKRSSQGGYLHHNSSSYTDGGITFSTSARSGGTTGDIWFQYT